jgi:hypothetical protein
MVIAGCLETVNCSSKVKIMEFNYIRKNVHRGVLIIAKSGRTSAHGLTLFNVEVAPNVQKLTFAPIGVLHLQTPTNAIGTIAKFVILVQINMKTHPPRRLIQFKRRLL